MIKYKTKRLRAIIILAIALTPFIMFFAINASVKPYNKKNIPQAVNGILDLSDWDFKKDGIIPLNGQWDFYYNELIEPSDFKNNNAQSKTGSINIPGNFLGYSYKDKTLGGKGYATYKLKVITNNKDIVYSLKTEFILTAHKLWAGDNIVSSNGIVGKTKNNMVPQLLPQTGSFSSSKGEFDVVLQVSNFYTRTSQIDTIFMGTDKQLLNNTAAKVGFDFFLLGSTIIMALYHIGLYLKRKKDKSTIYFGILCAILSLRTMLVGERFFVSVFPNFNFFIYMKLCYLTFFSYMPFLILFIKSFYSNTIPDKVLKFSNISGIVYFMLVLICPIGLYDYLIFPFEAISLALLLYSIYKLILVYFNSEWEYKFIIISILAVLITRINDILYEYSIIQTGSYAVFGLLIFIIAQSYVLAERFSENYSSIEEMTQKLKLADKLKDDFLATTSHELKTPLNGIIGLTDGLVFTATDSLSNEQLNNIHLINSSAHRLSDLVNDILDFSKLKNNYVELEKQPIDLKQMVQVIGKFCELEIEKKRLVFSNQLVSNLHLIYADEKRVQQILYNLIGNAIKFTHSGSIIISAIEKDDFLEITVSDTGIGISKYNQELIFSPYEQGNHDIKKNYGGTGLGLYITKKLIELHGGVIRVESELEVGTKFIFTLPLCKDVTNIINKPSLLISKEESKEDLQQYFNVPSSNDFGEYKILIVDDIPINIKVLESFLLHENYSIVTASNGSNALQILNNRNDIDLVILDMMMPGMLGYEVCEVIRKTYSIFELPILVMTASSRPQYLTLAFNSGANDYLMKPFDKTELLVRVKTLITLKHSVQSAIELQKTVDLTQKQVDNLNQSFEESSKTISELIEHDKFKTDFFVNISHELRTPLNVIWGTVQLLKTFKNDKAIEEENIQNYFNVMNQNCLRLIRLINNLIDTTRIEGEFLTLNIANDNIVYVIEEIALSVATYTKNQGITLIFDTEVEEKIMAFDKDKIERVILNLLSNAIKFTEKQGNIWINILDLGESIKICVRDDGIGIPNEKIDQIFTRFAQVDRSLSRRNEGSGIGLALVKSLIELHNGTIQVKSELGVGSEFIIELPVNILPEGQQINSNLMYDISDSQYVERINIEFSDIYT